MQQSIHPKFYTDAEVHCRSCGYTFTTGSTVSKIVVEVCSSCHPTYTGEQRYLDTQGRVQKFEEQRKKAQQMQAMAGGKKKKKDRRSGSDKPGKSLRELLGDI